MTPEEKQQMKDLEKSVKDLTKQLESYKSDTNRALSNKVDRSEIPELVAEHSPVKLPLDSETTAILLNNVPIQVLPPVTNTPTADGYIPMKINGKDVNVMTGH